MEFLENTPLQLEELRALLEVCPPLGTISQGEFEELARGFTWTCRERGGLAAFLAGAPRRDAFHVKRLAVHPNCRRRGLARELLRRAAWTAFDLGLYRLTLTVRTDNEPARVLYRKLGFQPVAEQRRWRVPVSALPAGETVSLRPEGEGDKYPVTFLREGRPVGTGFFNRAAGGCRDVHLVEPERDLPAALGALAAHLEREEVFLMAADPAVTHACEALHYPLDSMMEDMELKGAELGRMIE